MGQSSKKTTWDLIAKWLSGEATAGDEQELEKRLKENPELHYPMQTISDLWKSSPPHANTAAESAYGRHLDRMRSLDLEFPVTRAPRRRLLLTGLSALLVLGTLWFWLYSSTPHQAAQRLATRPPSATNEVYTANGSRTHMTLPDGTLVWLNAGEPPDLWQELQQYPPGSIPYGGSFLRCGEK